MVLAGEVDDFLPGEDWKLEVTDHTGLVLFRLDVCLTESAAITQCVHAAALSDKALCASVPYGHPVIV